MIPGMGWIKDAKASAISGDAQTAWDQGLPVFTPILNLPTFRTGFSGQIVDWSMMVASILEVGWTLHTWAVATDDKGRPQAMPLFTR